MQPRIHVITLAVNDLERALAFYRDGLGLQSPGVIGTEFAGDEVNPAGAAAMFQLGDLTLSLYPRTELAKDASIPLGPPSSGEFSIGHAVASRADVDALLAEAQAAGGTITDRAHERPWGSTRATFATSTGTSGRSCGARSSNPEAAVRPDREDQPPSIVSSSRLRRWGSAIRSIVMIFSRRSRRALGIGSSPNRQQAVGAPPMSYRGVGAGRRPVPA